MTEVKVWPETTFLPPLYAAVCYEHEEYEGEVGPITGAWIYARLDGVLHDFEVHGIDPTPPLAQWPEGCTPGG